MSYEVYVDVRHHPRHLEDFERRESFAAKMSEPDSWDPSAAECLRAVVNTLRSMADKLDPDWTCTNCGQARHQHHNWKRIPKCFNRYGPTTQWSWWQPVERSTAE